MNFKHDRQRKAVFASLGNPYLMALKDVGYDIKPFGAGMEIDVPDVATASAVMERMERAGVEPSVEMMQQGVAVRGEPEDERQMEKLASELM